MPLPLLQKVVSKCEKGIKVNYFKENNAPASSDKE